MKKKTKDIAFTTTLIRLRHIAGLTQTDMAGRIGVSQPGYCRYEAGDKRPPQETLLRIARVHDVDGEMLSILADYVPKKDSEKIKRRAVEYFANLL